MEQNFQTSFIPRKSIVKERAAMPRSVSFLTIISFFILFTILIGTGGLYFFQRVLTKNITQLNLELGKDKNTFELNKISDIQVLDNRLRAANDILNHHIAVTPIFKALEQVTMKSVRFSSFNYDTPTESNGKIVVKLVGVAVSYSAVALQADLFASNKNFIDPVFSNLQPDDKGYVGFDLTFQVDPSFVNYKETLKTGNNKQP
jgi:hypothetical protein